MSNTRRLTRLMDKANEAYRPWGPAVEPTYTLDRQIAQARAEMGEARWKQLQAEWDEKP